MSEATATEVFLNERTPCRISLFLHARRTAALLTTEARFLFHSLRLKRFVLPLHLFFFFKSFFFSFFSLSYFWYLNYRNHFHPLNRRHVLCICIRFVLVLFSKAACCTLFTITIIVGPWLSTKDSTTSRIIFFFSFFHFTLPSIKISFCVTVFLSPIIFFFFSVFCSFFFFSRSCSEWKTTEVEMTDWKSSIRRIIWHTSRWECTITMNNRERWVENSLLATHSVPNTWFVPENEKKIRTEENSIKYHFLYIDARNTWILLRSTTRSIS